MQKLVILTYSLFFLMLTGCGKTGTKWVTDINVETASQGGLKWVVTDFQLNIGDTVLPFKTKALPNGYGNFRTWRLDGQNYVGVDLNLTQILGIPAGYATLPNGQPVPVDTNGVGIIEIDINDINGKVYVAHTEGMTLVGVAAAIEQMDGISDEEAGLYSSFEVKGVEIIAGVFTSVDTGKAGIAIFANLGSLWEEYVYNSKTFKLRREYVSRSNRRRILRKLRRLLKKKIELNLSIN